MAKQGTGEPAKDDLSERLLQLTCALLFAERGLTKQELFRAITTYANSVKAGVSEEALNKMFERDKEALRENGIQLEVGGSAAEPEQQRYLIASDSFVWPKQVQLNSKQLQLLELAAQVWSHASLEADANLALIKLRALGIEPASEDLIGFAPRLKTHEPAFAPLSQAIEETYQVSFNYRKPDGSVSKRQVQPWSLHNVDGQWLLQCLDIDVAAPRNFLLRRIVSKVQASRVDGELVSFAAPSDSVREQAEQELREHIKKQIAELKVDPDTQAWFHFHLDDLATEKDGVISFHYMDLHLLAEELRDFALDIKVLKPKELELAIRSGFEKVAADHA